MASPNLGLLKSLAKNQLESFFCYPITNSMYYAVPPFDAPGFGRYWLIKSRKSVFVQPQEIYSFQQRDAGNYILNMDDLLNMKMRAWCSERC